MHGLAVRASPASPIAIGGVALIAAALTIVFALLVAPAWEPALDDQVQYQALAHGLADRGEYTRATAGEPFIAEPLRAPGYPLFLAALCRTAGCDHWRIAIAQAALSAGTVVLVVALARRVVSDRRALLAGALVGLYPTFAYFAALALSETLATFLLLASTVLLLRTSDRPTVGRGLAAGLAFGALAATRWLFLPFIAVAVAALALARRAGPRPLAALVLGWALVLAPTVAYSEATLGRALPAGFGTQLWLGYFQARDPVTLDAVELDAVERGRGRIAAFVAETDRLAQPRGFIALDDALRADALALIAHAPGPWVARAAQRSLELWLGDRPYPHAATAEPSLVLQAGLATVQLLLLVAGLAGAVARARRRDPFGVAAALVVVVLWALSVPLWTEARFSLPVKPLLVIGAISVLASMSRGARSNGLRPARHERPI